MLKDLYHPVSIGSVKIPGNIVLAPLAGYTDKAFRAVCLQQGASLTYSEMVSAEAIARKNDKTSTLMERTYQENQFAIQIFLPDAEVIPRCIEGILAYKPTIIDVNCGCPVPKVIKTGAGSALMKTPEKVGEIVKALKDHTDVPITVKIRTGWDLQSINYPEVAGIAEEAGAALITMHARTRAQGYSGTADWEHLTILKKQLKVPVFGSGDMMSPEAIYSVLAETGIDGVMVARGAIGNPFIFSQTISYLTSGKLPDEPVIAERLRVMLAHLDLTIQEKGEAVACREMRKHISAYTKGIQHAAALRNAIVHAQTQAEYHSILHEWFSEN